MSETETYKGYNINIVNDTDSMNPRADWDNGTTMVCFHRNYTLGDEKKNSFNKNDYGSWEELKQAIIDQKKPLAILPLYLYDHSGITMNTTGFTCSFDSMCIGFIYVDQKGCDEMGWTKEHFETVAKGEGEHCKKYKGKSLEDILLDFMVSDVEIYDNYLTGSVYGFQVEDAEGNEIEDGSCYGFFGCDHEKSGLLEHARNSIDCEIKYNLKARFDKLKEYIKAKVPVIYRTLPSL